MRFLHHTRRSLARRLLAFLLASCVLTADRVPAVADEAVQLSTQSTAAVQADWNQQYNQLATDIANRAHFDRVAAEAYRRESLIIAGDRDPLDVILRRTAALLADLRKAGNLANLDTLARRLADLTAASANVSPVQSEARLALFMDICRLRREMSLSNPLLDFSDILFIKHHRALYNHMCDQYYGMAATPGGALCILRGRVWPAATGHRCAGQLDRLCSGSLGGTTPLGRTECGPHDVV